MLTPMDIHNKEFKRSFRGYNEDEIDEVLPDEIDAFGRIDEELPDDGESVAADEEAASGEAEAETSGEDAAPEENA